MKQLIKNVLGIAAITLFLGIVYASLNTLQAEDKKEVAYTPLGIPLIAGPGSIASSTLE